MAVWLGSDGGVKIERTQSDYVYAEITPADVDPGIKRFGLSKPVNNLFITGDRLEITRVDADGGVVEDDLDFVAASGWPDNKQHPDGAWYINVDPVGGIRLFYSWFDALAGSETAAVALVTPSSGYRLRLRVLQGDERCLGNTQSWTLNTNREVADITGLGEGFRKNKATTVSGSGELDCLFNVRPDGSGCSADAGTEEFSHYLHRLALRLEIGSVFTGIFVIKHSGAKPLLSNDEDLRRRQLFYKCTCVISEVGIEVNTEDLIHSSISFVTTGEIELLFDYPQDFLLQENAPDQYKVLQESDFGVLL